MRPASAALGEDVRMQWTSRMRLSAISTGRPPRTSWLTLPIFLMTAKRKSPPREARYRDRLDAVREEYRDLLNIEAGAMLAARETRITIATGTVHARLIRFRIGAVENTRRGR